MLFQVERLQLKQVGLLTLSKTYNTKTGYELSNNFHEFMN